MEMADGDRLTPQQAEALSALRDGRNVFLSGNAGTGKSYVLNAFISDLKARNVDFLALAPTGIAALNLTDGSTIHRTLKIAPGVCAPDGPKGSRKVLDAAKVIIIDEISMCRIDLFDHVMGMISQSMTRNGAKQVVLVGDFFQLFIRDLKDLQQLFFVQADALLQGLLACDIYDAHAGNLT